MKPTPTPSMKKSIPTVNETTWTEEIVDMIKTRQGQSSRVSWPDYPLYTVISTLERTKFKSPGLYSRVPSGHTAGWGLIYNFTETDGRTAICYRVDEPIYANSTELDYTAYLLPGEFEGLSPVTGGTHKRYVHEVVTSMHDELIRKSRERLENEVNANANAE